MHIHAQLDNGQINSILSRHSQVQFIINVFWQHTLMILDRRT